MAAILAHRHVGRYKGEDCRVSHRQLRTHTSPFVYWLRVARCLKPRPSEASTNYGDPCAFNFVALPLSLCLLSLHLDGDNEGKQENERQAEQGLRKANGARKANRRRKAKGKKGKRDKEGKQGKEGEGNHVEYIIVLVKLTLHLKDTSSPALALTVFGSSTISGASVMKVIITKMKIMKKMKMTILHATSMTTLALSLPSVLVAVQDTSFPVSLLWSSFHYD